MSPAAPVSASGSPPRRRWRRYRFVPLGCAALALLLGLWTGLWRLGLPLPGAFPALAEFHGALMIAGFLGTLISLERAVALGRWWAYVAPAVSAIAAVLLIADATHYAALAFLLAGLALTFDSLVVVRHQPALFTIMLAVASACWSIGTAIWALGGHASEVTGWWLAFLVLTVAAERLELSRLLSPPPLSQAMFVLAVLVILAGVARGELAGERADISGLGLLALTAWLIKHDIARRTVRMRGQTRFSAACMLSGYFWLGAAGLLLILVPPGSAAFSYDAAVHAVTVGFVLSMIFAHAPIVLPAVVGLRVKYSAALYAPLVLLHLSLLLRIATDLLAWTDWRGVTGPMTVLALLGYAGTLIVVSRGKRPA